MALRTSSGFTAPSQGTAIGAKPGGVGRHTPGAGGVVKEMSALRPSLARNEIERPFLQSLSRVAFQRCDGDRVPVGHHRRGFDRRPRR